jgi:hypothetical protein
MQHTMNGRSALCRHPLLERYFEQIGGRLSFPKDLRRSVIFGRNGLVRDARLESTYWRAATRAGVFQTRKPRAAFYPAALRDRAGRHGLRAGVTVLPRIASWLDMTAVRVRATAVPGIRTAIIVRHASARTRQVAGVCGVS